jgi:hypothetical protein
MKRTCIALLAACGASPGVQPDAASPSADAEEIAMRCDAPATFADGMVPTRVLLVSPGATGGDGSIAAPFGTIGAAAAVATPGTFIQLAPGTHAAGQYIADLRGTPQAPIWIGGAPGTRPVIEGGAEALHLTRPAYVVVHDLEVRGQTANGLNIDDGAEYANDTAAHHVAILNVHVHDVGGTGNQDCIKVSGVRDLFVYDSRFERCGGADSGSAIDHVGCHRSVIARNVFDAMSGNAVQAKGGSTDIDVRQNRMRDAGVRAVNLGGSTGLEFFRPPLSTTAPNAEARRVRVFDNIITGTSGSPFAFVGCVDCLVAHNLFYGSPRWLIRILQETVTTGSYTFEPASGGRVVNNSFVWTSGSFATHVNVGASTNAASFAFARNVWESLDDPSQSPVLPVTEDMPYVQMGTAYRSTVNDPYAPLGTPCNGPERSGGIAIPEVTGSLDGHCRGPRPEADIGPSIVGSCTL